MARNWKDSDLDYLQRFARSKTARQLAQRFAVGEAEVVAKLGELGLDSKDGAGASAAASAAGSTVELYEQALRELHAGRFAEAAVALERVVAAGEPAGLSASACQQLALCRRRLAAAGEAAPVDPFLAAVVAKNRGDLSGALALCLEGGRDRTDDRFALLAAGVFALTRRPAEAAEALAAAIALDPRNRVRAFHDPDLAELRGLPEFAHLFGAGPWDRPPHP